MEFGESRSMSFDEVNEACNALQKWFVSQNIRPGDALHVLSVMLVKTIGCLVQTPKEDRLLRRYVVRGIGSLGFEKQ